MGKREYEHPENKVLELLPQLWPGSMCPGAGSLVLLARLQADADRLGRSHGIGG
jgi:hypothetical protein